VSGHGDAPRPHLRRARAAATGGHRPLRGDLHTECGSSTHTPYAGFWKTHCEWPPPCGVRRWLTPGRWLSPGAPRPRVDAPAHMPGVRWSSQCELLHSAHVSDFTEV